MSTTVAELKIQYFDLDYELYKIYNGLKYHPFVSTDNVTKKIKAALEVTKITREQLRNVRACIPEAKDSVTIESSILKEHLQSIVESCDMLREYTRFGMLDDSTGLLVAHARPGTIAVDMDYSVPLKPGFTKLI